MNVLYFHQHFSTRSGSAGTRSYEFARCLIERGHRVTMVCGSYGAGVTGLSAPFENGARSGNVDGIDIIELELPYSNRDSFLRRVLTFVKFALRGIWIAITRECDVVFATSTPLTAGLPGIAASLLRRKPFVFEVRDLWPELPREMGVITNPVVLWLMSVLEWMSYHTATRCIGLAPGVVGKAAIMASTAVCDTGIGVELPAGLKVLACPGFTAGGAGSNLLTPASI